MIIVFFGAHPDDNVLKDGGVAAKYAKAGHKVYFIDVTAGELGAVGNAGGLDKKRIIESENAAKVIGAESINLMFPDGGVEREYMKVREKVVELLRKFEPDIIFTHPKEDYHDDHNCVNKAVRSAFHLARVREYMHEIPYLKKTPFLVYTYSTDANFNYNPEFKSDLVVDISDVIDIKEGMLKQYSSQNPWFEEVFGKDLVGVIMDHNKYFSEKYLEKPGFAEIFKISHIARVPDKKDELRYFLNGVYTPNF